MGFIFFLVFVFLILFGIFLCLLLFASMLYFIFGIISFILGKRKERKGKKTILVKLSIVLFAVSLFCMLILVGFGLALRANNGASFEGYVDTGKVLIMTEMKMEQGFELDGEKFILLKDNYDCEKAKKKEAIYNILPEEAGELEQFLDRLLNFNSYDTLYEIENDSGFPIYASNGNYYIICCRERDYEKIQNFYQKEAKMKYYYTAADSNHERENMSWTKEEQKLLQTLYEKPNPQWKKKIFQEQEIKGEYYIVKISEDTIYSEEAHIFFTEEEACLWMDDIDEEDEECYQGYVLDEKLKKCISKILEES